MLQKRHLLILLLLACAVPSWSQDLSGQWIRKLTMVDDNVDFNGNIIEISEAQDQFHGKLIHLSDGTQQYGYSFGDVKWKGIRQVGKSLFSFDGLLLRNDEIQTFNGPTYIRCQLEILDENHIKIVALPEEIEFLGMQQIWERVGPS